MFYSIRTMGGLFVPWTIHTWTFRTTDNSYYGLFVPFTNITYATKANVYMCVCQIVCLTVYIVNMY